MNPIIYSLTALCSTVITINAASPAPATTQPIVAADAAIQPKPAHRAQVEICFVLDTTGSMAGLIEGAKRKIWTIANHIVQQQNAPQVRFSLIGYRDRGDAYITKLTPLTDDLDALQQELNAFSAGGGGDNPESVNQALFEAMQKIQWSNDAKVKKIVFLVGDAPPHMDYPQDVTYMTTCAVAKEKHIIINAIQCGQQSETTQIWAKIAVLAGGQFVAIPQDGGAQAVHCPQDEQLAELSQQLNQTVIPYGNKTQRSEVHSKCNSVHKLSIESQAARASYNWSQSEKKAITGNNDFLVELDSKRVDFSTMKKDLLPDDFKNLSVDDFKKEIAVRQQSRAKIQAQIDALVKARSQHLKQIQEAQAGKSTHAFDTQMRQMLDKQLAE